MVFCQRSHKIKKSIMDESISRCLVTINNKNSNLCLQVVTMSYRDLRNFTEMMHELGYPRLISMENFRTPNFPLVAEILIWLGKRFDPDADIPFKIQNEEERVSLIRSIAQLLVLKANLKLNTKKLYQGDGYAVKEMLKVTNLLYESLKSADLKNQDTEDVPEVSILEATMKVQELKKVSQLVGEIVASGATLYDLLGKEGDLRELRNNRASRHMELPQVEQALKESITSVCNEIENTKQSIENIAGNETTLDTKIEKKKADLDRHYKRLQTLKKIRPAFMEEFEKLEEELKELYNDYVIKYRNIAYLENVLEQTEQAQQKRINQKQAITRKLIEDLKQDDVSEDVLSESLDDINPKPSIRPPSSRRTVAPRDMTDRQSRQRKVFGSMTGPVLNDSESLEDSESDLLLDGDITEDDEIEIDNQPIQDFSDDDF